MKELKLAWRYVRRHWWQYILGILALFIVDEVNTYVPRFTGEITNGLDQHTLDMGGVMGLVWKIVLIGVIIAVGRFAWRFFLFGSARSIEKELRSDLFAHLSSLSPHYYNEHKTGDLMARFINDLQAVRTLVGMNVISTFDATVMLLLVLWQMMTYVSPKLTGVAVLPLILIIFGDYFYGKVMHKRFLAKQQAFSTLTDQVQETVSGIRVIKSFVQERKELYAFAKTTLFTKEKNLGVVRLQALVMPLLDLIVGIASLLTLAYGGYLAIYGEINIGQFISFNSYVTMLAKDYPINAFYGYVTDGLFQNQAEVDAHAVQPGAEPGDIRFIDQNGDGMLDTNDRVKVGSGTPKVSLGFNINLTYKDFDLVANFYGDFGAKRYNYTKYQLERMDHVFNYGKNALNAWTPENPDTDIPRAVSGDPNKNSRTSTRFVENGDYLRLNNLQIGYNLPVKYCKKMGLSNLRIYVGATRLFTITNYKGYDPSTGSSVGQMGYDYAAIPLSRDFMMGLKFGF